MEGRGGDRCNANVTSRFNNRIRCNGEGDDGCNIPRHQDATPEWALVESTVAIQNVTSTYQTALSKSSDVVYLFNVNVQVVSVFNYRYYETTWTQSL